VRAPEITIRPYRSPDAASVTALFQAAVREIAARDYSAAQVTSWAAAVISESAFGKRCESKPTWLAEVAGRIAGFSDLEPDGHIDMLYVHPEFQGRGVARALLQHVEQRARALNLRRLYTEASITARPVFEARGFRVILPQTVTVGGVAMTNYRMEKHLASREAAS
jgi:putative acetyltransferase